MREALLRAWQIAHLEPRGPVYVCLDVGLQEQRIVPPVAIPDLARVAPPSPAAPDGDVIRRAAALLVRAERPLIMLGHAGDDWSDVIALAESLGAAVVTDRLSPAAFPTEHPLHQGAARTQSNAAVLEEIRAADLILAIHKVDVAGALRERGGDPVELIEISLEPYIARSWAADHQALPLADLAITANASLALASLRDAVARALADSVGGRRRT